MFNFIRRSLKRNFGADKEYYRFIDDMFGFLPNNIELYKVALIHKSASQSISGHHINNERLEYLGDAVIECITSDYLFIEYPDCNEGFLTQMRSKLVSRQSLNELARKIGLNKYLICHSSAGGAQKHIYGDAFEAMIGAIYLDKGYDFVNRLLINVLFKKYTNLDGLSESENDYKSRLIEWCQKNRHSIAFRSRRSGNSRSATPTFYTTVLIDNIEMGHGSGDSKKSAEQEAARSVSTPLDDDMCSNLLDKLDRIDMLESQANAADGSSSRSRRRRRKRRKSAHGGENAASEGVAAASAVAVAAEAEAESEVTTNESVVGSESAVGSGSEPSVAETAQDEQHSKPRSRRGRKRKSHNAEADAAVGGVTESVVSSDTAETSSTAESTTAEAAPEAGVQPAKRRGRRKKSEVAAEASNGDENTSVKAESEAQGEAPTPRRRGRPRKNPAAEASGTVVSEGENTSEKPARKRRTRKAAENEGENTSVAQETGGDEAQPKRRRAYRRRKVSAEGGAAEASSAEATSTETAATESME